MLTRTIRMKKTLSLLTLAYLVQ